MNSEDDWLLLAFLPFTYGDGLFLLFNYLRADVLDPLLFDPLEPYDLSWGALFYSSTG